jgi:hypothetical protein
MSKPPPTRKKPTDAAIAEEAARQVHNRLFRWLMRKRDIGYTDTNWEDGIERFVRVAVRAAIAQAQRARGKTR